ncbi:MAG: heparinase II/III domain-containing protein [Candidatus Puniceispirillales bacterium]
MMNKQDKTYMHSHHNNWSVSLFTQILRRSHFFNRHYTKAARAGKQFSQYIAAANMPLTDLWKGDANKGQPLATGITPLTMLEQEWHDFGWLRDMREYGGQNARTYARKYILDWIMYYGLWDKTLWHPVQLARRIRSLILTWNWYGQSAPESQQMQILSSLIVQSGFLQKDLSRLTDGDDQLNAISALLIDSAFRHPHQNVSDLIDKIFTVLDQIILKDGCHATRRLDKHITCLSHLHEIRYALTIIQKSQPDSNITDDITRIDILIGQMGAVGRMWRLGDTALLAMCHGLDAPATLTETVLDRSGPKGKICQHAQEGGFIRLASGRSVMVMNTAPDSTAVTDMMDTDAAANAVEFSFQKQRILISGGHHHALSRTHPNLAELMKGTSAHSTLSIDMINASQLTDQIADKSAVQNRNRSPSGKRQAVSTMTECGPATGGMLAVATHNGYKSLFGALHERKLFLATGGHILKGQDIIHYTGDPGNIPSEALIRFHLHPKIHASQTNNRTILLKLPASMPSWKFICSEGRISLEDSITAINGTPQRCQQIVISVALSDFREHMKVETSWGLMKLARKTNRTS